MRIESFEVGPFMARCLVLADEASGTAVIVDPGFDVEIVIDGIRRAGLAPDAIVLTHGHIDHAFGVAEALDAFPAARLLLHPDDLPLYRNIPAQAKLFGMQSPRIVEPHGSLADGDRLPVGAGSLLVRHAPGHSPGHVVLLSEGEDPPFVVAGDVLFAGSIGRTDLWGGSFEILERSIREILYRLPGVTRVLPGHGPETTIAAEITSNPFVAGA
jgi:hydroxyacylglutathione hydrolase